MRQFAHSIALLFGWLTSTLTGVAAQTLRPELVASNLQHPWAVAFLPGGVFWSPNAPAACASSSPMGRWALRLLACPR